jgi:hypothetical protein
MTQRALEKRLATLEREFEEFKKRLGDSPKTWRETFGMFADDPEFDAIVRLGNDYRKKQRPRTRRP